MTDETAHKRARGSDEQILLLPPALLEEAKRVRSKAEEAVESMQELIKSLDRSLRDLAEKQVHQAKLEAIMRENCDKAASIVNLNVRGKLFTTYKSTLLRIQATYFHAMLNSGVWLPSQDGTYFIDRKYEGFERILECLTTGRLSLEGLSNYETQCVRENIDYFQIPANAITWDYSTSAVLAIECDVKHGLFLLGERSVISGHNEVLKIWNCDTGLVEKSINSAAGMSVYSHMLSESRMALYGRQTVEIWDIATMTLETTIRGDEEDFLSLIISDDRKMLLVTSEDSLVRFYEVSSAPQLLNSFTLAGPDFSGYDCVMFEKGILCCDLTAEVAVWDLQLGLQLRTFGHVDGEDIISISSIGDKTKRVCVSYEPTSLIRIYDIFTGALLNTVGPFDPDNGHILVRYLSRDLAFVEFENNCSVAFLDAVTGNIKSFLKGQCSNAMQIIQLADGRVATCADDNSIKIWDPTNGNCLKALAGHTATVLKLVQLKDGRLCSLSQGGEIRIWT